MIHPGSSLDKAINNTRVKNVSTDVKHGQIQERKGTLSIKKMMISHPDLNFTVRS